MATNKTILLTIDAILSQVSARNSLYSTQIGFAVPSSYIMECVQLSGSGMGSDNVVSGGAVSSLLFVSATEDIVIAMTRAGNTVTTIGRLFILGSDLSAFTITGTIANTVVNILRV